MASSRWRLRALRPSPRSIKVWRDVWGNKTRAFLVIASIAVGVFAVGTIAGTNLLLTRELHGAYRATNPANAILNISSFDEDLLDVIRRVPGVEDAEGRRVVRVRARALGRVDEWLPIQLLVIRDFDDVRIHRFRHEEGAWPPRFREILLERSTVEFLGAGVGDTIEVEALDDLFLRQMRVAGLAHDLEDLPAPFSGRGYGFITLETLEWLGGPSGFNELHIVVEGDKSDVSHIREVAASVRRKVENGGRSVHSIRIPIPGRLSVDDVLNPMILILGALGLLSLAMSSFLVINTLTAILTQHVRQIGVMKAIGARSTDVALMYFKMVLLLGLGALAVGLPLASLGARLLTDFVADLLNFDIQSYRLSFGIYLLQIGVGLIVPFLAATYPIWKGTRRTVREAISDYGIGGDALGSGFIDRLMQRVRGPSRPLLLSLRNTFRRKGRLVTTLITLSLSGATFIAVTSVQGSLLRTLDDALQYWKYDVEVVFGQPQRIELLESEALSVPGVAAAESWLFSSARRVRADGTESRTMSVIAPPHWSTMIVPSLVSGRWIVPGDENAVVINTDVLKEESGLAVGDEIVLKIGNREESWRLVGVVRSALSGPAFYTNREYLGRVLRNVGRSNNVNVTAFADDAATRMEIAEALKERFEGLGLRVHGLRTVEQIKEPILYQFNLLVTFLMIMAVLLAVVGAIGLAGTMSINVLERIKEIGLMRAIGASSKAIRRLVIVEGLMVALISWIVGGAISVPLSAFLSRIVGLAFMEAPLSFRYSFEGVLLWLGIVLALGSVASLFPARHASRLTVRDVLSYE